MSERVITQRKLDYRARLEANLAEYSNILIINVDNVGSNQLQKIRIALRGKGVVLLGKNTIIRKVLRESSDKRLEKLIPHVHHNIGFVFTNSDLAELRKIIMANKVPAAAKTGGLAPSNYTLPEGPTGLDPGQTSFFQALNIATKIVRGAIEIINPVPLIKEGDRVTASATSLLSKLNIKPFFYGARVPLVYEAGSVYDAKVLDFSQDDLLKKFQNGVNKLTAVSLAIGYPTAASISHSFSRAFKNALALALVSDFTFKQAEEFKAGMGKAVAAAPAAAAAAAPAKKEEKPKEKEPEPEEDMNLGGGMFGDD